MEEQKGLVVDETSEDVNKKIHPKIMAVLTAVEELLKDETVPPFLLAMTQFDRNAEGGEETEALTTLLGKNFGTDDVLAQLSHMVERMEIHPLMLLEALGIGVLPVGGLGSMLGEIFGRERGTDEVPMGPEAEA